MKALTLLLLLPLFVQCQNRSTLPVKGLREPVELVRDSFGVNHIYAKNQHDLFFTQGYCAAKDRLFQFEIWRRQATGTLAEVIGPKELKRDIGARLFTFRGDLDKELRHYHPQGDEIIRAFTDGVNAYISEALQDPSLMPEEFRVLGIRPGYWTPEVVISRHAAIMANATQELNIARAIRNTDTAMVKDLLWFHPYVPTLTMDPSITKSMLDKDILGLYTAYKKEVDLAPAPQQAMARAATAPDEPSYDGSNNWIVSGQRSASGYPLLANDPHRKISVPSLRYLVHLNAPGWNVTGAGEPTIPGISIGHNEYGAWGLTIAETDAEDIYVYDIDPGDPTRYKYKGEWVRMRVSKDTIAVKNAKPVIVDLHYTVHGPVTFMDTALHKAYALRCGWLEPGGAPYLAALRMDQAKTWEEFREACSFGHMPGENMIWADRKGNTGWQVVGINPLRSGYSGYVPVMGDGRHEWTGYQPIKDRPYAANPATGFLVTANENVTPNNYEYPNSLAYIWADPYRGNRIRDVLAGKEKHSIEDMAALQHDYLSLPAGTLVPMLRNIQLPEGTYAQARDLLKDWDMKLEAGSIPAAIYVMWEREISARAKKYFVPDNIKPYITLQLTRILQHMEQPEISFGQVKGMARDAFLKECFIAAIDSLQKKLGPNMDRWQYGQAGFKHAFLQNALLPEHSIGPLPRGGYGHTPGATGNVDNQNHGASFRMVVDTRDWDRTLMINSPGQSANPRSPYYSNLFRRWAEDKYFPAYFSKEKIMKTATAVSILKPKK